MCCGRNDGRTEGQRQNSIPPQTQFAGGIIISKGHYSAKKVAGVTVLIVYMSSDAALYLYQVS